MNIRKIILVIALISICMLLLSQVSKYRISQKQCIGCGLCVQSKVCPTQAITMKNGKAEINTSKCIGCGLCKNGLKSYKGCPVNAINADMTLQTENIVQNEPQKEKVNNDVVVNKNEDVQTDKKKLAEVEKKAVSKVDSVKTEDDNNVIQKVIYFIDEKLCIGCRLCVSQCPVNAISMVKGKAVIDLEKCISCGLCKNGNPSTNYKGCPVSAIKTK